MTGYDDEDVGEEQPQSPLEQFSSLFQTPTGRAFAQEAQTRIADYAQQRQIAEANTAAGEAFHQNLSEMHQNFVGMVQDDPGATHLALDLAGLGVNQMVSTIPGADPKNAQNIATGMQRDIARTAVMSLADQHEGLARNMLDNPRISDLLGDERDHLTGYISGQELARKIDGQAAQKEMARVAVNRANSSAWNYAATMVDPDTGEINHAPEWAKRVMADPMMPPPYKAQLFDVYGRLTEQGDAPVSDPETAGDLLKGAAQGYLHPMTALSAAGDSLRAADAVYIAQLANDPTMRKRAGEISTTLDAAQRTLATPENGQAGQVAYQRFANWLIPTARDGADLNPSSKEYVLQGNRMQMFAPQASDVADYVVGQYNRRVWGEDINASDPLMAERKAHPDNRMALDQIFAGRQRPVTGDQVVRTAPKMPMGMPTTDYGDGHGEGGTYGMTYGKSTPPNKNPAGDQVLPPSSDNVAVR